VHKPFRLGRVHGLSLVFRGLQPCVGIYIFSLIVEQLTHACATAPSAPSWRKLLFSCSTVLMIASGFLRARRPLASTDLPFLLTCLALLVIAMLPPPAVLLAGPLCASPTLAAAAERLVRALTFSLLYCVFVYAAAPPVQSSSEVLICTMRASAASIWVLAAHAYVIVLAIPQAVLVVYVRVFSEEYNLDDEYSPVPRGRDVEHATERLATAGNVAEPGSPSAGGVACDNTDAVVAHENGFHSATVDNGLIVPQFSALGKRGAIEIGGPGPMSAADMAAIAARLEAE
jgi:hypothetical protein